MSEQAPHLVGAVEQTDSPGDQLVVAHGVTGHAGSIIVAADELGGDKAADFVAMAVEVGFEVGAELGAEGGELNADAPEANFGEAEGEVFEEDAVDIADLTADAKDAGSEDEEK